MTTWANNMLWKSKKTAKLPLWRFFGGFCRFLSGFSLFWWFLSAKPANLENDEFWKSEKPPNRQYGGFSAVFVRFLAVFHYFADFYWPNRLIWQVMDYGNLKNRQTANMAVFRRFLCWFCRFFSDFSLFWQFSPIKVANLANYGIVRFLVGISWLLSTGNPNLSLGLHLQRIVLCYPGCDWPDFPYGDYTWVA